MCDIFYGHTSRCVSANDGCSFIVYVNFRFLNVFDVHGNLGRGLSTLAIFYFDHECPSRFRFEIKLTSVRQDKFLGTIVELERNIGCNYSKGQIITIGVRCDDVPDDLATRPIGSVSILFRNRKGLVGDDRVFVYGGYFDCNLELFRRKRTIHHGCFRSGVIRSLRIDNVFLLFAVIQGCTGLYLNRCILVAQLDDFKRAVESRVVTARNIHQRVGVGILVSFIGNVGYFDGAARYRMIQFVHREVCFCYRRLVVDRNDIDLCCEFIRRVATCTVTNNFVFERCVVAAEFIFRCLVGEFAQIGYSNHLAFGYGGSVVNECSRRREPRDDNGGERLRSMLEVEF